MPKQLPNIKFKHMAFKSAVTPIRPMQPKYEGYPDYDMRDKNKGLWLQLNEVQTQAMPPKLTLEELLASDLFTDVNNAAEKARVEFWTEIR